MQLINNLKRVGNPSSYYIITKIPVKGSLRLMVGTTEGKVLETKLHNLSTYTESHWTPLQKGEWIDNL